jgi:hypothetical protein
MSAATVKIAVKYNTRKSSLSQPVACGDHPEEKTEKGRANGKRGE